MLRGIMVNMQIICWGYVGMYMVCWGEEGLGCTFFLGRLGVTPANSVGELWSMYWIPWRWSVLRWSLFIPCVSHWPWAAPGVGWGGDITWQQSDEWDLGRARGVSTTLIKPLSGYVCSLPQKLLHRIWMSFPLSLYLNFKLKKLVYLLIYLFLAVLSLHCCAWLSLVVACRLLTAVTSLVAEQRLGCCRCSGLVAP